VFAFYLAVIFAAIHAQTRKARHEAPVRQQTLSVIIIAQDEADRIEPCLQSVANWADEIIVLDSGSSDNTVEIARRYTDQVFETDWPGYGPQKQRALEKANCDWVLSIDADERVSPELRQDIDAALNENPECVGYRMPWAVMVYGHRMDFGRSARSPMRLFKREGSRFTDAQVHEHIVLPKGKRGALEGRLYHYTHRNYGHALQKSAKYAWLGGQKRYAAGKWGGGLPIAAVRSLWNFILIYFFRLGFLDGAVGFLVAVTYAQGAFNKYAALWTLRRDARLLAKK
jgi:glycosyltransferase involved in cell wall biosynthesis